jgi:glutamyl-tRNA synthetase
LYDYLLAKKTDGKFILRIEDTDTKRTVPGAEQEILEGLRWLGLHHDEGPDVGGPFGPYRQTERREVYHQHAQTLVAADRAYPCFCLPDRLEKMRDAQRRNGEPPHYDGTCLALTSEVAARRVAAAERHVIRFKMPHDGVTVAHDLVRGDISVENKNIDDYVILKSDGLPTYHLAAVVDDHLMEITHVLRGAEWLSTFPLHVNIVRAFGWSEPKWVHLSLFLKPSGKGKMSKRDVSEAIKDGHSIFIKDMRDLGITPEGLLNWMVLMGWGVAEDDVMTLSQMIERFDLGRLNPAPAAINFAKLDHFNATHIRSMQIDDLAARLKPHFTARGLEDREGLVRRIAPLVQERITTLDEAVDMAGFFFQNEVKVDIQTLIIKGLSAARAAVVARTALGALAGLPDFQAPTLEGAMRSLVDQLGLETGKLFGLLRAVVTGQKVSPPLFETMEIVGRAESLKRLEAAVRMLEEQSSKEPG